MPDVAACNLFARKLNFLARLAVPLLSFGVAAADSVAVVEFSLQKKFLILIPIFVLYFQFSF